MITLGEAARVTGGRWLALPLPGQTALRGGAYDTRTLAGEEIFFALSGEQADGHDHLHRLAGTSVRLAVVSREAAPPEFSGAVLLVEDTLAALARMGAFLVEKHRPRVVAITGSYGKTTAKEVIAAVLSAERTVLKSPGSLNNEIGIPVTLLQLDGSQQVAVLEFSARKPGDIDALGRIAPPDVAVLLAVGHAHVGVFGSRETIYEAKGEVFNHLREGGLALVNAADPRLRDLTGNRRTLAFGRDQGDYHAEAITYDQQGRQRFTGVHDGQRLPLAAGMPGPHGCEPVLAAWAVARELGISDAAVSARGGREPGQKGRLQVLRAPGGAVVIDDCYNASPETVINLIETLNARPERDKVLVLGPLAELEEGLADSAGQIARALAPPLNRCIVYAPAGPLLYDRLREFLPGAPPEVRVERVERPEDLTEALRALDAPDVAVGIKGARSAHMERHVRAMMGTEVRCRLHPCFLLQYCTDCDQLTGT